MITRPAALLVLLLATSGCAAAGRAESEYPDGSSAHTMTAGGLSRTYRVYKPTGLPAAAPLVVMLHGGFGSGEQAEKSYGWDQLADSAKFIVAYPDGLGRAWNVHGCCGRPAKDGVGFVTAMVGISNGGMMSYTLACTSGILAAIGPDSATQLDACTAPHPTSVMHIHGTADLLIPYNGGHGLGVVNGPSVADVNASWRNIDQCGQPALSTDGPVTTSTAECPGNRSVVLVTIDGGGHQWPGGTTFLERGDTTSQALNATETLWQFFAAHPA